jgi:hypothetical protein
LAGAHGDIQRRRESCCARAFRAARARQRALHRRLLLGGSRPGDPGGLVAA